jgi:flagellar export protein FliJ
MKRFSWPLQKLLDVTNQRELAAQAHLGDINARLERTGQSIARRKQMLRDLLAQLGRADVQQRISSQTIWMTCTPGQDRQIRKLQDQLGRLETQKAQALKELHEIRTRRMSYEKLREKAHEQWEQETKKRQQQQLDEAAAVRFVLHPAGNAI